MMFREESLDGNWSQSLEDSASNTVDDAKQRNRDGGIRDGSSAIDGRCHTLVLREKTSTITLRATDRCNMPPRGARECPLGFKYAIHWSVYSHHKLRNAKDCRAALLLHLRISDCSLKNSVQSRLLLYFAESSSAAMYLFSTSRFVGNEDQGPTVAGIDFRRNVFQLSVLVFLSVLSSAPLPYVINPLNKNNWKLSTFCKSNETLTVRSDTFQSTRMRHFNNICNCLRRICPGYVLLHHFVTNSRRNVHYTHRLPPMTDNCMLFETRKDIFTANSIKSKMQSSAAL